MSLDQERAGYEEKAGGKNGDWMRVDGLLEWMEQVSNWTGIGIEELFVARWSFCFDDGSLHEGGG